MGKTISLTLLSLVSLSCLLPESAQAHHSHRRYHHGRHQHHAREYQTVSRCRWVHTYYGPERRCWTERRYQYVSPPPPVHFIFSF